MIKKYYRNSKPVDINDVQHPFRKMAIRIIEEVVEVYTGINIEGVDYYKMEDDIVALLSNLE